MNMPRALLAIGLTLLACVPATAQTQQPNRPERPYRGIFASGVDDSGQSLTANGDVERRLRRQHPGRGHEPELDPHRPGGKFGQVFGRPELLAERRAAAASTPPPARRSATTPRSRTTISTPTTRASAASLQVTAKPAITLHQSIALPALHVLSAFPGELDPSIARGRR